MLNEGRRARRARHRRRRRPRRDPRPPAHRGADRRPRGRPAAARSSTAGATFEEMDVDAVLARKPAASRSSTSSRTPTCPGSRNEKRWQDVDELLDAGIDVISTREHPAPRVGERRRRADHRRQAAGDDPRRGRARRRAGRARRHDARGAAPPDGARQHLPGRAGRRVARQLLPARQPRRAARARAAVGRRPGRREPPAVPRGPRHRRRRGRRASASSSRSPARPGATSSIRRAARMARRAQGELLGVHVRPTDGLADAAVASCSSSTAGSSPTSAAATTRSRPTTSRPALVQFARAERATQIVLGASRQSRWTHLLRGSVISKVLRAARDPSTCT